MSDKAKNVQVVPVSFEPNEILYEPGTPSHAMYIIEAGEAEVFRMAQDRRVGMVRLRKGDLIGELAMIVGGDHHHGVRAITALDCLKITRNQFNDLMDGTPNLVSLILRRLVQKLRRTDDLAFGSSTHISSSDITLDKSNKIL